jgi:2-phosphoglycerate kinase
VQTDGGRPLEKYRANFDNIRLLGHYIEDLAREHGTPLVHSLQLDRTVAETLELIVTAATGDDLAPVDRTESEERVSLGDAHDHEKARKPNERNAT